jgi:hypothetical protein
MFMKASATSTAVFKPVRLSEGARIVLAASLLFLSGCMDTISAVTPAPGPSPAAFGATTATNLNNNSIQLNWPAAPSNAVSFTVYQTNLNTLALIPVNEGLPVSQTSIIETGLTANTLYSYVVRWIDGSGNSDGNMTVVSALTFGGVTGSTGLATTSAYVTFAAAGPSATSVNVYCSNSFQTSTLMAQASNTATSVNVTGLLSGTTYTCNVRAVVTATTLLDDNTATTSFQTVSQSAQYGFGNSGYQGVVLVQAYGDAPNAQAVGSPQAPAILARQVSITWANFGNSTYLSAYKLVRVAQGGTLNMNTSTVCTATTQTACQVCVSQPPAANSYSRTCTDFAVAISPQRYEYAVTYVVNQNPLMAEEMPAGQSTTPFRILVPIPPSYMTLVHRDSVNYEMCTLYLNQHPDPSNHQRCLYTGQGATPYSTNALGSNPLSLASGYYDFGYDLFVDRFGEGCNWTPASNGGMCNAGMSSGDCHGVLGTQQVQYYPNNTFPYVPKPPVTTIGSVGNVYWATDTNTCWYKVSASKWISNATFSASDLATLGQSPYFTSVPFASIVTNVPNTNVSVPPLVGTVHFANEVCQAQVDSTYGPKRIMRKREFVAASGFQTLAGEPNPITDTTYLNNLFSSSYIGNNSGASYTPIQACYTGTLSTFGIAGNLPYNGFNTAGVEWANNLSTTGPYQGGSIVLGSVSTQNCTSRFGIQDLLGNNGMWLSDQLSCTGNGTSGSCNGTTSSYDAGNTDLNTFYFNGTQGPGGASGSGGAAKIGIMPYGLVNAGPTNFLGVLENFAANSGIPFSNTVASYLSVPLGLPMVGNDSGNANLVSSLPVNSQLVISGGTGHSPSAPSGIIMDTSVSGTRTLNIATIGLNAAPSQVSFQNPNPGRFSFDGSAHSAMTDSEGDTLDWGFSSSLYGLGGNSGVRCVLPAE